MQIAAISTYTLSDIQQHLFAHLHHSISLPHFFLLCSLALSRLKLLFFFLFIPQDNRTAAFHIFLFIYANYRTNEEDACYAGV